MARLSSAGEYGPAHFGAGEQLVIAEHERAGVDQAKAGADPPRSVAAGRSWPARCRRTPRRAA